jgi:uncharacterized protein (TIGR04255 family)
MMFEEVKIPKKIDSPINEAVFEIRYEGNFPGEALYGVLFDVFEQVSPQKAEVLPIMQIPAPMRDMDPNLRYQSFYRTRNNNFAFSVGPRSIVFSALKPYVGWSAWVRFFQTIVSKIKDKNIIKKVERIGLRTFDVFDGNIFGRINANLSIREDAICTSPSSFYTEFDLAETRIILNVGNAANVNGEPTQNSLIDIDCIHQFNCNAEDFFLSYGEYLDKAHDANKQVFFGLLKDELLNQLNPVY